LGIKGWKKIPCSQELSSGLSALLWLLQYQVLEHFLILASLPSHPAGEKFRIIRSKIN